MARNRHYAEATQFPLPVPADTESGDALVIGDLPCVALTDRDDDGESTVQTDGAFLFGVAANNGAIDAGDIVYLDSSGDLSNTASGGNARFGYALEAVGSGSTTTIPVKVGY